MSLFLFEKKCLLTHIGTRHPNQFQILLYSLVTHILTSVATHWLLYIYLILPCAELETANILQEYQTILTNVTLSKGSGVFFYEWWSIRKLHLELFLKKKLGNVCQHNTIEKYFIIRTMLELFHKK